MMDEPCSRDDLRACLRDISRLNRWFMAYRPSSAMAQRLCSGSHCPSLCAFSTSVAVTAMVCVASSAGHVRAIIAVELTGLDINEDAVAIASEAAPHASRIQWVAADVFAFAPQEPIHLVISSQFAHHLSAASSR